MYFCKTEAESLIHLFWSCRITSCFWHSFNQWLPANQRFKSLSLTPDIILGLRPDIFENKQHYLFFLIARYFIWVRKTPRAAPQNRKFPELCCSLPLKLNKQFSILNTLHCIVNDSHVSSGYCKASQVSLSPSCFV